MYRPDAQRSPWLKNFCMPPGGSQALLFAICAGERRQDEVAGSRRANRALRVRHCRGRRIAAAGEGGVEFVA
jgi:hypothetical protein